MSEFARGLEGVVVASTSISKVDGERGALIYRGIDIHDLAASSTFEEVVFLLWHGNLPRHQELVDFAAGLAEERRVPAEVLDLVRRVPRDADPMATLRTAASLLSAWDPDAEDTGADANRRKARRLTAGMATLVAAIGRAREGQPPVAPDPSLSHAANFLYMLQGKRPDAVAERTFDQALVLHADHGFNASTFAARVTTSTFSDMHSAVVSAIGTLKGPLHGGANTRVMQMLLDVEASGKSPEDWVREALEAKQRVMGFGHRVYKVEDPRAVHLRRACKDLGASQGDLKWYRLSQAIEKIMADTKGMYPNVDFYSASTYWMLGIPMQLYTPIFALSRVSGWTAHVMEQAQDNRLIRPRSDYVGKREVTYTPLESR